MIGLPPRTRVKGVGRQQAHPCLVQPIDAHGGEVMYIRSELGNALGMSMVS